MDDRVEEGGALNNIGGVYEAQGRYTEALEHYQQALAIAQEVGDRAGGEVRLNNIGAVYAKQGQFAEALDTYQQAQVIQREIGARADEATTLANIGGVYGAQGRYAEALAVYQQALAITQEVGERASEGTILHNIGAVYDLQGRNAEAWDYYQHALAIRREVNDQAGEAATLINLSGLYHDQVRYAEALDYAKQALTIFRKMGERANEGTTLNNIGVIYSAQEDYAQALDVLREALAIMQDIGDRTAEASMLNNIGAVYHSQKRYAEALDVYQQALAIYEELGAGIRKGTSLSNIGSTYEEQGKWDQALAHYEEAMEILETLRTTAGSDPGRAGFIAQYASIYDRTIGLYHQQGQNEAAFDTSERGRARAFLDSLTTGHVELSDDTAAKVLAAEQTAYAARQAAEDALAHALAASPPDSTLIADLRAQLEEAEEKHAATLDAIEAKGDQLAALVPGRSTVMELTDIQALLDEQITIVSYYVLSDEGTLAFIITQDSLTTIELSEATPDSLHTAVEDLSQWLDLEDPHPRPLRELYAWLVAPLTEHLHTPLVGIVPHQSLHYVPFAALTDGETYFGQQYTLFTLPSASALPFIQENADQAAVDGQESAVVVGNPTTGDYDPVASLATERDSLGSLPFAEEEARAIAALYGSEPLLGQDATESIVRAQSPQTDILHLAAHGKFNAIAPLSSLIALAPDDTYDGWLTVGEVYGLDLKQTDLVVLSACQSNAGELSRGDELVGLTRAFFFAGTPTVISSLWSVDDAATKELMVAFYRHWQAGLGKAAALQAAQAEVREKHPSPFYWAAFVLSGDPGSVSVRPAPTASAAPSVAKEEPEAETRSTVVWWGLGILVVVISGVTLIGLRLRRSRMPS